MERVEVEVEVEAEAEVEARVYSLYWTSPRSAVRSIPSILSGEKKICRVNRTCRCAV